MSLEDLYPLGFFWVVLNITDFLGKLDTQNFVQINKRTAKPYVRWLLNYKEGWRRRHVRDYQEAAHGQS
jgi:hypothetical protein